MTHVDVAVIGSGAGGLTAALALARAGRSVTVFEKHYLPGGWCHSFPLGGYRFSPGVHYIGALDERGLMSSLYQGLGVSRHLTFLELNPDGYDHVRIGDEHFDIPKGLDTYRARLKARFPSEARGIDRYLDTMYRLARVLIQGPRAGLAATRDLAVWAWRPLDRFLDTCTRDPLLKAILTIQGGDHGLPPSRCPTAMHAAIVAHYFKGGFYPKGGARALPKAFMKELRAHGGQIKVKTGVERILVRDGRAVGVRLEDGSEVAADLVVSNADPHMTFDRLLGREHTPRRIVRKLEKTTYSVSCLSLFFAVDADLRSKGYDSGNYWYSRSAADVGGMYDQARLGDLSGLEGFKGTFVTITTLKDPSKRSDGVHTCEAFTFVSHEAFARWQATAHGERPADYQAFKAQLTEKMLDVIERATPGLRDHVVFAELGTPLTNQHYINAHQGNLYGTAKTMAQLGPFAFPIETGVPGLMMCGASTLGHGVAGASMSGLVLAGKALGCSPKVLLNADGPPVTILPSDAPETWPETVRPRSARADVA